MRDSKKSDRRDSPTRIVMLPGMHGTGRLFSSFAAAVPKTFDPIAVAYPTCLKRSYNDLELLVRDQLRSIDRPFVLLAESFSGPIAIRIAARPPANLAALVLVATFVRTPISRLLRPLAQPILFRRPPPRALIRRFLSGRHAEEVLIEELVEEIWSIEPAVMADRARQVLSVDVREAFSAIKLPMLFCAGSADRLLKNRREQLKALNDSLEWAEIAAPHLVLQAAPQQAAEVIGEFLERVLGGDRR